MLFGRVALKAVNGSPSKSSESSGLGTGLVRVAHRSHTGLEKTGHCVGTARQNSFVTDLSTDLAPLDLTALARRRPWASTPHLALTYLRSATAVFPALGAGVVPVSSTLVLSVSKRLAPAAPLRNMIRRVLREAWRHQSWRERSPSLAVMIRLRALPLAALSTVAAERPESNDTPKVSTKAFATGFAKPLKGRAVLRIRRTDRALKAIIRAEADSLLESLSRSMNLAGLEQ